MRYAIRDYPGGVSYYFDTDTETEADLLARFPDAPQDVRDAVGQAYADMLTGFRQNSGAMDYLGLVAVPRPA